MVSCDIADDASSSQNERPAEQNTSLKNLPEYVLRFTLLAGNLLFEGSKKENFVFSPLNIFHAFSALHKRSVGATRDELCSIFGFPDYLENTSPDDFHVQLAEFLKSLSMSKHITSNSATGMFAPTESHITAAVSEITKPVFNRKVPNVLISPAITIDCINEETFETRFSKINVDMMSHQQYVQYLDDSKFSFRILGLPYKNKDFSMYIQLQRDDPRSTNFSNNFDAVYLSSFIDLSSLEKRLVYYKIPRFHVATTSNLKDVLVKFGSQNIMTSPMLDNMQDVPSADIVDIKHGASFEFTHTDAQSNAWRFNGPTSTPPIKFFANKPFTFFVYHHPKKCILLSGAISKPLS